MIPVNRCRRCWRVLQSPAALAAGIGKECRNKTTPLSARAKLVASIQATQSRLQELPEHEHESTKLILLDVTTRLLAGDYVAPRLARFIHSQARRLEVNP